MSFDRVCRRGALARFGAWWTLVLLGAVVTIGPASAAVRLRTRTLDAAGAARLTRVPMPGAKIGTVTVIVAARGRVSASWKQDLEAAGARLVTYLPDGAFLARVPAAAAERLAAIPGTEFTAPLLAADKLAPELGAAISARPDEPIPILLLVAPDAPLATVAAGLGRLGLAITGTGEGGSFHRVAAFLPPGGEALARSAALLEEVVWIEPRARRVLLNDTSIWVGQSGTGGGMATPIFDQGIKGAGQTVAILDTGLDFDMCYFRDPLGPPPVNLPGGTRFDPTRRKVVAYDMLYVGDDPANPAHYDDHGHGTHVAGSVGGDDDKNLLAHDAADGLAPAAKLVIQDGGFGTDNCSDLPALGCPVVDLKPIFLQAYQQGARFHSNSWGDRENFSPQNTYTAACVDSDEFMYAHPDFLILFAAGNSGPGDDSVGSPSVAKNTISVGATQRGAAAESIAGFSSRGHAADGRLKPTVTAPGSRIVSAAADGDIRSANCDTVAFSGTSMACPTTAGLAALAAEYFAAGFYPGGVREPANAFAPSAALCKATLINSARSMTGEPPIPSRSQGWGRVTLADTLFFPGSARDLFAVDDGTGFATGAAVDKTFTVEVKSAAQPLKATLVWTDPPSNPMAAANLINDLDLRVSGPAGTYLGNVFANGVSSTGGSPDRINVEEQVLIASPAPGTYTITVSPQAIPSGPQPFALVVTGDLPTPLDLDHDSYSVDWDENGDGWPDPGEKARLAFNLRNVSDAIGAGVTAELRSLSPELTVTDAMASWPDIAPGATAGSLPDHFAIEVSPSAPCGARLPLKLVVTAGGKTFESDLWLVVGAQVLLRAERFDGIAEGALPPGWLLSTDQMGNGVARADATVEPVATAPGPSSPPRALFVGKSTNTTRTRTEALMPLDLSPWAGRPLSLSFRWWAYATEADDALIVSVSDAGPGPSAFQWEVFRAPAPWDTASNGGLRWTQVVVDLAALSGFTPGKDVWVRFETSVNRSEAGGDGYYVDDIELRAPFCLPSSGCSEVSARAVAAPATPVCPNTPVILDGSGSTASAACPALDHVWSDPFLVFGRGPLQTVFPLETSVYRLDAICAGMGFCFDSRALTVPVLPATRSLVDGNSLRAVAGAGARSSEVDLSWTGTGGEFNLAATRSTTSLATLWTAVPLNPAPLAGVSFTDTPALGPGELVLYAALGTYSCNGRSAP